MEQEQKKLGLINDLSDGIIVSKLANDAGHQKSWSNSIGVIITRDQAEYLLDLLKRESDCRVRETGFAEEN